MEFEWDSFKSQKTLRERGFDFAFAAAIFDGFVMEAPDTRHDYGEDRVTALGRNGSLMLVVTYTDRVGRRRIISARQAKEKERFLWQQQFG